MTTTRAGKVLRTLMERDQIKTEGELSRRTGVPQPTIHRILSGESRAPELGTMQPLARFFRVTIDQIYGITPISTTVKNPSKLNPQQGRDKQEGDTIRFSLVPLISWIQAGNWTNLVDNLGPGDAEEWLPCPVLIGPHGFALTVRGVSMEPTFREGDIIFVDPDKPADNGSLVVVRLTDQDEGTFKKLIIEGDRKYLHALNPNWPDQYLPLPASAVVSGVVVFHGRRT